MNRKRECCKHGVKCYRRNTVHRNELAHPGDVDYTRPVYNDIPMNVPACSFGNKCIRRNPLHFQEFSHPPVVQETCESQLEPLDSLVNITSTNNLQQLSLHLPVAQETCASRPLEPTQESNQFILLVKTTLIKNLQLGKGQTIRVRVVIKSDKHLYSNSKGDCIMSTMDLIDESGEIRFSAFGPSVHQFFDLIEVDEVYYFSNFTVNRSDPKPGVVSVNRFTLVCNDETRVLRDPDQSTNLPHLSFDFQPLASVDSKDKNDVIDIIAICESYGPLQDIVLKNNKEGKKRELYLVDKSKEMMMTIWGSNAENFDSICTPGCAIAFKRARVSDYAGKCLDSSCLSSSTFKVDPCILEALALRYWFETTRMEN